MQISYSRPLDQAWSRMKSLLFGPFDLGLWFVLGFTAWLAQLGESGLGGATSQISYTDPFDGVEWNRWADNAVGSARDFLSDGLTAAVMGLLVIVGLVIWLVFLWVSSRGRFMLLDNLVHRRTRVKEPWREFRAQGDSLFLWQVVYSLVASVTILGVVIGGFLLWVPLAALSASALVAIPLAILTGCLFFLVILVAIFIEFFLTAFVVPLMYRDRLTATQAWSRWLVLFREHPGRLRAVRLSLRRHPDRRLDPVSDRGAGHLLCRLAADGHALPRERHHPAADGFLRIPEPGIPGPVR